MTNANPFKDVPVGTEFAFEITRTEIQKGRSFSEDALRQLLDQVNLFVGTQIATRWTKSGEPPTAMTVHVRCEIM